MATNDPRILFVVSWLVWMAIGCLVDNEIVASTAAICCTVIFCAFVLASIIMERTP